MTYARQNIEALHAYVPGEQPRDTQVIKLNTNENPYPPTDAVMKAIAAVSAESLRRYPPPMAQRFCETAARVHGLKPHNIIATNGGDELLRLAMTVFCEPFKSRGETAGGLSICEPSYSLYPVLADIQDAAVHTMPLKDDWSLPEDWVESLLAAGCKLAIVVNPHAPTGQVRPASQLAAIARRLKGKAVLLIDEAYVDFAESDAIGLLDPAMNLDNVLLLRSMSKGYSLAGLRFGYGLGSPGVIEAMNKAKDSYNTDAISQAAAIAALGSRDLARENWRKVIAERTRVTAELRKRGFLVLDSQSNFVLATAPAGGMGAKATYQTLKDRGIFVRYFDQDRLRDKLRITIGTPEQNTALLRMLDEITAKG
jgi:histidinol-phosphate aminotransferase